MIMSFLQRLGRRMRSTVRSGAGGGGGAGWGVGGWI